ncbi:uncharacterized protein LOC113351502 [Papaver somniferum]|uniref:uncharacterized protein LOC113351502 n=1 Tax=Papaver somniferum TaxID=3469 RepID=UPI000E7045CA|nr:uncharacterized protein LOC113351502 [Papaver somniferum]
MPNHTRKFLVFKISNTGPVIKPIPILPIKKQLHKDFVVQQTVYIDGMENIPVHEERQCTVPLVGLEDSFLGSKDNDVDTSSDSDTSPLLYPPGFEPPIDDISDDVCSGDGLVNVAQPVIPVKLRNELKRLGMSVEVFVSPPSRTKRFEVMWFLENEFLQLLEEWWFSFCFAGTPSTVLWMKLKALKEKLRIWNNEVFGHTNTKLNEILSKIQTLAELAEDNILTEEETNVHFRNKVEFEKISKMEETCWKIKSNTKWLQEGDMNTSFFISNASARRRFNRIRQLYIGGELVSDRKQLQDHIVGYYCTLFTEEEVIRPNLDGIDFDTMTSTESDILEANFT